MFTYCPPVQLEDLKSQTFPDGKRYYTLPDGTVLPSVTTVIGAKKKDSIQKWRQRVGEEEANRVSRKASNRGTKVHQVCEDYLNNEQNHVKDKMPDVVEMFYSIKPLVDRINNIWYQEQSLFSKEIEMAGRCDVVAEFDGKLSIIDFKTSSRSKRKEDITDYFAQCTAYAMMIEEMVGTPVDQIVIIMAVDGSEPLLFVEKTHNYIDTLAEYIQYYTDWHK
jgi:genome maintenance exonuclease 1